MTYQQQVWWFTRQHKNVCPRDQILLDLQAQIEQWQSEGDMVIVLADINEDIRLEPIPSSFRQMGLSEITLVQHGHQGPNTHNRGTMPIDGIFIPTSLIPAVRSGYFAFGEGIPSDHRAIWLDIPLATLGWFQVSEPVPLRARRLKCNDPRIIRKYNEALQEQLKLHNLEQRITDLTQQVWHHRLTRKQQQKNEENDRHSLEAKKHAETTCRKLKVGHVQWCPQITKAITQILYCWKGIQKQTRGGHVGSQQLQRLAKKGGATHQLEHAQLAKTEIEKRIRQAYKLYSRLKKIQADETTGSNNSLRLKQLTNTLQKNHCGRRFEQQRRSGTMQE